MARISPTLCALRVAMSSVVTRAKYQRQVFAQPQEAVRLAAGGSAALPDQRDAGPDSNRPIFFIISRLSE
jgi:hypothetical protein